MSDDAAENTIVIDKVRASKAGHAYHEAWAARTALELLPPSTDLTAITLEGFDERDEQELGTGAVEIADLVRYHGGTDVARSHSVVVVQFKYSIASANKAVRAADLAPTLTKFATADAELRVKHGDAHVEKAVRYEYATNRPIHENLGPAIEALVTGTAADGDVPRMQTSTCCWRGLLFSRRQFQSMSSPPRTASLQNRSKALPPTSRLCLSVRLMV